MISDYVAYLSNLKLERNLSIEEAGGRLDDMLINWEKINRFFSEKREVFYVFSSGSANELATETIAKLNNNNEIRKNNYYFRTHLDPYEEKNQKRYSWRFELLKTYD